MLNNLLLDSLYGVSADGHVARRFDLNGANLKELRMASSVLRAGASKLRDVIQIEGRQLTASERTALQGIGRESDALQAPLATAENRNEAEREEARAVGGIIRDGDAVASDRARAAAGLPAEARDGQHGARSAGPARGHTYADIFPNVSRSMDGWGSSAEYLAVIGMNRHDSRLRIEASSGVDDPAGGYAVPTELASTWITPAIEDSIVMPRAVIWPMATRERQVPAFDFGDRSANGLAGLSLVWESETGTMDLQASKTRKIKLIAHKGAIYTDVSNELLADGLGYDAQLNRSIQQALSYGLDRSFLWGVGGAQPLGVFNSGALITVDKEVGQTAATIVYENLVKMFSRLTSSSVGTSVWLAHASTIPQLAMLSIAIGTGGTTVPVMTESNGQFRILTRPVIFTEKVKPLGQLGDIALMDFSQYVVGLRSQMMLERSGHVGFAKDVMTYRATLRIDGQPNIDAPYELPNSAASVSPFITLEARS